MNFNLVMRSAFKRFVQKNSKKPVGARGKAIQKPSNEVKDLEILSK